MSRPARIVPAPHAAFRKLGGGAGGVVLHLRTTAYFQLNDVGAAVWRILEDGATAEEVVHRLRESLGGAPPGLESDVARFLDELVARDLVALERVS